MTRVLKVLMAALGLVVALQTAHAKDKAEKPNGVLALEELREGTKPPNPVQNRFFLKSKRFELTPMVGFVPTNQFASRFNFSLGFGYHFNEALAVSGIFTYAPDLGKNDTSNLVLLLLQEADAKTSDPDFRQPLDKVELSAALGVTWSPFYGKINLFGEVVANFDFWFFLGVGFVLENEWQARLLQPNDAGYNPDRPDFAVDKVGTEAWPAGVLGLGANFFITQTVALRLDGRIFLYPDNPPFYPTGDPDKRPTGLEVNSLFSGSVGVAFFIPKMKPRLYDF